MKPFKEKAVFRPKRPREDHKGLCWILTLPSLWCIWYDGYFVTGLGKKDNFSYIYRAFSSNLFWGRFMKRPTREGHIFRITYFACFSLAFVLKSPRNGGG